LIGNELLIGKIEDTNGKYIINKLLTLGHQISRVTIIEDDVDIIAETIQDAIERNPVFIFTCGGLGPTYDDMTFEGVAKAFNVDLVLNEKALGYIKERYQKLVDIGRLKSFEMNESRTKMANIPQNAKPLKNSAGAAPGILIEHKTKKGKTKLISMPGFPDEMQAIFEEHVVPLVQELVSHYYHAGIIYSGVGEGTLAGDIIKLRKEYPEIWIKTHPEKSGGKDVQGEIHLTAFIDSDDEKLNKSLKTKIKDLREKCKVLVEKYEGKVLDFY
jgi:nicotinamide-nucleotide amidase